MPFKNKAQSAACYAANDPGWDCSEWSHATDYSKIPKGPAPKKRRKRKTAKKAASREVTREVLGNGQGLSSVETTRESPSAEKVAEMLSYAAQLGLRVSVGASNPLNLVPNHQQKQGSDDQLVVGTPVFATFDLLKSIAVSGDELSGCDAARGYGGYDTENFRTHTPIKAANMGAQAQTPQQQTTYGNYTDPVQLQQLRGYLTSFMKRPQAQPAMTGQPPAQPASPGGQSPLLKTFPFTGPFGSVNGMMSGPGQSGVGTAIKEGRFCSREQNLLELGDQLFK